MKGPINYNGEYYIVGENGYLTEGWVSWSGDKYYALSGGKVAIGWLDIDGKQYYFDYDGVMLSDAEIDGIKLGADGAAVIE